MFCIYHFPDNKWFKIMKSCSEIDRTLSMKSLSTLE